VDITEGRIVVLHLALTGDAELDAALQSLIRAPRPPTARHWVGRPGSGIRDAYLQRLTAAGVLSPEQGLLRTRWRITDPGRIGQLRARLDAVATSTGPLDMADVALGGLVHAAGADRVLYPGWGNRARRDRLAQVAKGDVAVQAASQAARDVGEAANRAATQAAMQAATQVAVQAATQAAVAAGTAAASAAAADAGAHHGGHH
jgi:Golgi phosphoprotein 3 (GPP34)